MCHVAGATKPKFATVRASAVRPTLSKAARTNVATQSHRVTVKQRAPQRALTNAAAEFCDGVSVHCGADLPAAVGTPCRAASSICDKAEYCDGSAFSCPSDEFADGVVCDDMNNCTAGDVCQSGLCSGRIICECEVRRFVERAHV